MNKLLQQLFKIVLLALSMGLGQTAYAIVCEAPGALTGLPLNAYWQGEGTATAGSSSITIGNQRTSDIESSTTDASASIEAGDSLLIIQMQDADIDNSNDDSYGDGTSGDEDGRGYTSLNSTGLYEFVTVDSVSGSNITLTTPLENTYRSSAATTTQVRRTYQVIKVPRYFNLDLSGTGTVTDWNGRTGGVYVIDVANTLTVNGATLDASEAGFRGGGSFEMDPFSSGDNVEDYAINALTTVGGEFQAAYKGEGISGTPALVASDTASGGFSGVSANLTSADQGFSGDLGYPNSFDGGRGGAGNAGGGGLEHNAGGGGGSNFGSGGDGGASFAFYRTSNTGNCQQYAPTFFACDGDGSRPVGGDAGAVLSNVTVADYEARLFMGGGGGAGSNNNAGDDNPGIAQSSGGDGGGIIIIRTLNLVQGSGSLSLISDGGAGQDTGRDGAGGGGAGGSILVLADTGTYSFVNIQADGGAGGITGLPLLGGETQGPGGGGGGGAALIASAANIGSISTAGGAEGTNEPASGIFNPIGAETGSGNSVKVAYDPLNIGTAEECGLDYSDAPATDGYPSAAHTLIRPIFIGNAIADEEDMVLADDNSNGDVDEDGLQALPTLTTADATYTVDVLVTNNTGVAATLFGWLDFDDDGSFEEGVSNEAATVSVPDGTSGATVQLTWTLPAGVVAGDTWLRLRLTSDASITTATPDGIADDGEVEDHPISILAGGSVCSYPTADGIWQFNGSVEDSSPNARVPTTNPLVASDFNTNIYASPPSAPLFNGDALNIDDDGNGNTSFLNEAFNEMSLIFWMKPESFPASGTNQMIWDEGGGTNGVAIRLNGTTGELEARVRDNNQNLDLSVAFPQDDRWHHVGLVYDNGSTVELYLDGALVDSGDAIAAGHSLPLNQHTSAPEQGSGNGTAFGANGDDYIGYLDELVYWVDATSGGVSGSAVQSANMAELATCYTPVIREDYGDAPDTSATPGTGNYSTLLAHDGPRHLLSSNLYLGEIAADDDLDAEQSTLADGDDTEGGQSNNDEGAEQLLSTGTTLTPVITTDTSYDLTIDVENTTGGNANLLAWIDFDFSGTFDDTEVATATVADDDTTATLSWTGLSGLTVGTSYLRLRLTTDALTDTGGTEDTRSLGEASDGEVEDYALSILPPPDFGDAPPLDYGAAWHDISGAVDLYLGAVAGDGEDATEEGGDAGVGADGDDTSATDDEDGLDAGIPDLNLADTSYSLTVTVVNTGLTAELAAWLDFDIDGSFDEDEFATVSVDNGDTSAVLTWSNIGSTGPDIFSGDTYVRLRLTRDTSIASGLAATSSAIGGATDGEIEDHLIRIYAADFGDAPSSYLDASHQVGSSPVLYLGSSAPDEELFTQLDADDGADADGDDGDGNDDETAITNFTALTDDAGNIGSTYSVDIEVVNTGASANLIGWIDFDNSGTFDADEASSVNTVTASGTETLNFTVPADITASSSYARFRISTDTLTSADAATTDLADGEVEDYPFAIGDSTAIYLEAECAVIGNQWTANSTTLASEQTYLEPVVGRNNSLSGTQPDADLLRFDFNLPDTDTYDVYALVNFADSSSNSFQLSIDNSTWVDKDDLQTSSSWVWLSTPQQITGNQGDPVSLYIAYQELNSLIDKFAIVSNGSPAPTGSGDDVGGCFDLGDLPDSSAANGTGDYTTTLANFGAYHAVDGEETIYLGTTAPDTEIEALTNADATGDDAPDETEAQLMASNGGSLPALTEGSTSYGFTLDLFNNKGQDAFLFAWFDADNDGLFEESELDASAPYTISSSASGQTQAVSWTGLSITSGDYAIRLRLTTDTQLVAGSNGGEDEASVDVVIDGEVEDYFVSAVGIDYGDAPVASLGDYDDTSGDGTIDGSDTPASHTVISGISLGADADTETSVWSDGTDANGNATDDDSEGTDDEDGISTFGSLSAIDSSYSLSLSVANSATSTANVYAWIDLDQSGSFDEDERAVVSGGVSSGGQVSASTSGTVSLDWSSLPGMIAGTTYVRVRITTDNLDQVVNGSAEDDASLGAATDGEVEDYQLVIAEVDYGDAPISYGDPSHNLATTAETFLGLDSGPDPDGESITQYSSGADGDDLTGTDDEDGASPADVDASSGAYSTSVTVNHDVDPAVAANLYAWIDFDGNGTFDEDEIVDGAPISISDASTDLSQALAWTSLPVDTALGTSYVRIRITTDTLTFVNDGGADERATEAASDGEVEDYAVQITGLDYGDAPESGTSYSSLQASGGPVHGISSLVYLGDTLPDTDLDAYEDGVDDNGNATDDDAGGDEGIVQLLSSGSSFPALEATDSTYQLTVDLFNNSGSTANLYAWIDFDRDGNFDEDEVGTVTTSINSSASIQTRVIAWSGLGSTLDIQAGQTYARFRITTDTLTFVNDGGADERADGTASDGEVEDYPLGIGNQDYGDAPDTGVGQGSDNYRSLMVDDGPRHTIDTDIYLGNTAPDIDTDAFEDGSDSTGNAGDDEQTNGDEGIAQLLTSGASSFDALASTDDSYSMQVNMTNTSGGAVRIYAWIDFDHSGTFDEDESSDSSGLLGNVSNFTVNWSSIPSDVMGGTTPTYLRIRITSDPLTNDGLGGEDERSYGSASTGEVEDYAFIVTAVDFGDAPDTYGTTEGSSGASHQVVQGIFLGDTPPDGETDGFLDGIDDLFFASDDDAGNDEGIDQLLNGSVASFPSLNVGDSTYGTLTLDIATTANSIVYGWIDFDQDGIFEESERAEDDAVIASDGTATLDWSGLPTLVPGNTYARFRIATDGTITDTDDADNGVVDDASQGLASDGEVEDYLISITGTGTISGRVFEDPNYGGGSGRDYSTANTGYAAADVGTSATVELWNSDGATCTGANALQTTTSSAIDGSYSFTSVSLPGDYCVRVVSSTVTSKRTLGVGTPVAVQTYRVESTDGFSTLDAIVDEIGGRSPVDVEAAADSFDVAYEDGTASQSWSVVSVGSSGISGIDFGYNFNTIVNTNSGGQGSLRQFISNANTLNDAAGDGLAQSGQTAGIDVSIFEIPTTDPNYNLSGQGKFSISLTTTAFDSVSSPIELNATTQAGASCPVPLIEVNGAALTSADGFDLSSTADGSLVRGFVVNGFDGIAIDLAADSSTVDCNYIGTDVGGNAAGNGGNGTGVRVSGNNNQLGGNVSSAVNVVAGNTGDAVQISGTGNIVQGSYIGLGADGATQVSNTGYGVDISGSNNTVGDSSTSALRNRIAYNGNDGVRVSTGTGNEIASNSIYNNAGLGLNLVGGSETNGVTANDTGDGDSGSNNLLNFLTWNDVSPNGNDLEYDLDIDVPSGSYRIEFYANAVCNADQSGIAQAATHGEGQQLLGSVSFISSGSSVNIDSDLDPGDNFPSLSGVVPGLVGGEITALVIDDTNGHTSEFSECETAIASQVISGSIFEDVNYGGGVGRNFAAAEAGFTGAGTQATVELWSSDGVLCTGGAPIQSVTSAPGDGSYSFNVVSTGDVHCVRVVNSSVRSNRAGWNSSLVPVQTFRSEFPDDTAGSVTEITDEVGGESPQDVDVSTAIYDINAGDGSISQSVSFVDLPDDGTTPVTGIDFGFNFSTIVNVNSSGQGSLAQFILNANALGDEASLAQNGSRLVSSSTSSETLPTQTETSIFMISNGTGGIAGINPTKPSLMVGSQYADITLSSNFSITDDATNIDGTTLSVNVNNPNGGLIGSDEAVGATGSASLPQVYRPEVQVSGGTLNITASDVEFRGIAFLPTSTALNITSASNVLIENNIFGAGAVSFSEPGSGSTADLVVISGTNSGTRSIHNNLFGFGDADGLYLGNTSGWTISENEFQSFDVGADSAGLHIGDDVSALDVDANLFENSTYGLRLNNTGSTSSASTYQNNSILSNSSVGIIVESGASADDSNQVLTNLISLNGDDGIQLNQGSGNTLSQNSIFNNQGLGINLTGSANSGASVPGISTAISADGTNLTVTGTKGSGDTVELYSSAVCNGDTAGMAQATAEGEGQFYHDEDIAAGTAFSISVAIADLVGSVLTVLGTDGSGNSSEFSSCFTALVSDWGDAPDTYGTLSSSNGPNHIRNPNLVLGSLIDTEEDGFVDGVEDNLNAATDDDLSGSNDEDGVSSFPTLTTASSTYSISVSLVNTTLADAYLAGWIDFDRNGTFDTNEAALETVSNGATSATLTWSSVPIDIAVGSSFVRLRYSSYSGAGESPPASASAASPLGTLLSGEVEDYAITIDQGFDYGDAPASFDSPTPARHLLDGNNVYLGLIAPDGDALPFGGDGVEDGYLEVDCSFSGDSDVALDDDCEGIDDEDSATLIGLTPSDTSYTAQAVVTNNTGGTVYAYAWLDIDQDGEFEASEGIEENGGGVTSSGSSVVTFSWSSFSTLSVGNTHVRIRVSSTDMGTSGFVGDLNDGEVEDYRIVVSELTCDVIYGIYNDNDGGGDTYTELRTYNTTSGALGAVIADIETDTVNVTPGVGSAGVAIDPLTRRFYYIEWAGDKNGDADTDLYYFDGSVHEDVGPLDLANENFNRMAFDPTGLAYAIESGSFEIVTVDTQTPTSTVTTLGTIGTFFDTDGITTAVTSGAGGDIAFDIDGNLYMVTYETATANDGTVDEFFLWIIENLNTSPTARLLLEGPSGGDQVTGIAFFTDNLLYLQDAQGDSFSWDVGANVISTAPTAATGSTDLASCIYPSLVPVIDASKSVSNLTDPSSPGFAPGDVLEYTVTIRNTGGIVATNADFIDAIPANTTYVADSTFIERLTSGSTTPVQVPDVGGNFPYATATEIHSEGQADGTLLAVPSAGSLENGVVITFQVTVDSGTGFDTVCNVNGVVSYLNLDNNTEYVGTNDPTTIAGSNTSTTQFTETTDPTCLDKFSGYSIEGFVFEDLDSDELFETGDGETGIGNVEVVLVYPDNSCESVTTDASGSYFFGPLDPGVYDIYEADGAAVPTPITCPPTAADPSGFVSTTANSILSVNITNANFTDQNFGDVQTPTFLPNNSNVVLPGNTVTYAHNFVTPADGTVSFAAAQSGSPTPSGWTVALWNDADCNGGVTAGDTLISGSQSVSAGDTFCLVAQITAPLTANAGDVHIATTTATFDYPGSFVADVLIDVTDTTTVLSAGDGALVLSKVVENISCQSGGASFPCDYDDGAQKTDNNAQPGDILRYSISFQNIGTTAISGIDIFDAIPAYTALDTVNLLETDCTDPGSDFSSAPSITSCVLIEPAAVDNVDGYNGNIQWQLNGSLGAGESGIIAFDVVVD